ncbi:peptide deformylase [Streptomyces sp. NPDC127190]|uniref:peptide deformylase n=1 Tax=unclassified Streptomyces TaxID=2593676 RepID=UPI0036350704
MIFGLSRMTEGPSPGGWTTTAAQPMPICGAAMPMPLPQLLRRPGPCPPALKITVETTTLTGEAVITVYERGLARLLHHEIDHLDGLLYTARMRTGVSPIPLEEYRQTGRAWAYK